MPGIAHGFCSRCGDKLMPSDEDLVIRISYRRLSDGIWTDVELCGQCQKFLRRELYMRGMAGRSAEDPGGYLGKETR